MIQQKVTLYSVSLAEKLPSLQRVLVCRKIINICRKMIECEEELAKSFCVCLNLSCTEVEDFDCKFLELLLEYGEHEEI